jgi:hypothetical protein
MEKPASDTNIALAPPKNLQKTADDFQSQKKQTAVSLQIYRQLLSRFDVLDPGSAAKIAHEFPNKAIVVYICWAVKLHIQETDQFLLSNPFRGAKADMSK